MDVKLIGFFWRQTDFIISAVKPRRSRLTVTLLSIVIDNINLVDYDRQD